MHRLSISLFALLAAFPAFAEDIYTQAPVVAATVYPQGATLTHRATLDLSAGTHRVLMPYAAMNGAGALPRIKTSDGVSIGALGFHPGMTIDREALFTEAQAEAWAAVEAAQDAVTAKTDEIATASAKIDALKARIAFLGEVKPDSAASAEDLLSLADMVQTETGAARAALITAQAGLRPLQDALDELNQTLTAAQDEFEKLTPPSNLANMLSVDLKVTEAGPVTLELTEQNRAASWQMDYDLDLDRDAGSLAIARKVIVTQQSDIAWNDVALTLSTARPGEESSPSDVSPDHAWIEEEMDDGFAVGSLSRSMEAAPMPMAEMALVSEPEIATAELQIDGLAISYLYPTPVTIAPGSGAELALDELTLEATPLVLASPRTDETAFTVARFSNDSGEAILPGQANILRDGHFIGRQQIDLIPAGAETELGFGAIEGIRLQTIFDRNAEGDTGIINRSNTRTQTISFSVENLTGEAQDVRALFPLTYSEQEDLNVRINASPAPDESDIDHRRGVSAWDLALAPGEKRTVSIDVKLDWPQDQILRWYP